MAGRLRLGTLVCREFTPAQAKEWIEGGEVPELAKNSPLEYVDIDSGHWPMFTQRASWRGSWPTAPADELRTDPDAYGPSSASKRA